MGMKLKRLAACIIDFYIICFFATAIVGLVTLGKFEVSILTITIYFITFLVGLIFKDKVFKNASIGKRLLGLCIRCQHKNKLDLFSCIKRNITFFLLPLELILIVLNNKRLGDVLAKTCVVEMDKGSIV